MSEQSKWNNKLSTIGEFDLNDHAMHATATKWDDYECGVQVPQNIF